MSDYTTQKLVATLKTLTDHHKDEVIPAISRNSSEITLLKEEVSALYELLEMYVAIAFRLGFADRDNGVSLFNDIQTEYLACVAIQLFLREIAATA
jgi:hypothetical protein